MKKLICLLAAERALLVMLRSATHLPSFRFPARIMPLPHTAWTPSCTKLNTVTQTGRITVDFAAKYPPGVLPRVLPVALWVEKDTADGPGEMAYRARCGTLP